jgi:Tol biopolymer transport system component
MWRLGLALLLALLAGFAPVGGEERASRAPATVPAAGWLLLPRGVSLDVLDLARGTERSLYDAAGRSRGSSEQDVVKAVVGAAWAPDGRRAAFVEFRTGPGVPRDDTSLYVLDGGRTNLVAAGPARTEALSNPVWAADGRALVYQVGGPEPGSTVLEEAAPDGTGRRTVERDAAEPALSADGALLAFVRATGDGQALIVRPLAGGAERAVLPLGAFTAIKSPRFSPDGRRLAFVAVGEPAGGQSWRPAGRVAWLRLGPATASAHGGAGHPWVVDLDGGGLRRLVDLDQMVAEHDGVDLAWAPDGSAVAMLGVKGLWLVPAGREGGPVLVGRGGYGHLDWRP